MKTSRRWKKSSAVWKKTARGESIFELAWEFHVTLARAAGNEAMTRVIYDMIRTAEGPLYNRYFDPWQEIAGNKGPSYFARGNPKARPCMGSGRHDSAPGIR